EVTMSAVHYDSYTEARSHLKDLLDAASEGRVATVRRDTDYAAVVDAERLRYALAMRCPPSAEVGSGYHGWAVFLPCLPIAGAGDAVPLVRRSGFREQWMVSVPAGAADRRRRRHARRGHR